MRCPLLAALLSLLACAHGKVIRAGLIEGYKQDFKFINKFAFAPATPEDPSTIRLVAWTFMPGQKMLVYHNEDWFDAYTGEASSSCEARTALATRNETIVKGTFYGEAGRVMIQEVVQDSPSFWFIALGRCQSWVSGVFQGDSCMGERTSQDMPNGLFMYYELVLLNPGGYWTKHFSYDEQGLYETHIVFCAVNIAFVVWFAAAMMSRWQEVGLFSILTLLGMVSLGYFVRHALALGHYSTMASTGLSVPWAVYASDVMEYATTVAMTASLLVISKGWMISRHQLKRKTKLLQGFTTVLLCAIYGVMFTVEITARDDAATYNTYESASARVLAVVRVAVLFWFAWCVKRSFHQEDRPEVRRFYVSFGLLGLFWLASLPVYSLFISALPSWYRLKTLSALHFSTNAFTLISIGYLSTGQRRPVPVTTVEANVRDAASRQQPRLPGNSGPRSVQPMPDRPGADTPPPPPPVKVAVQPAGSSSSGAGASGAVVAGAPVTATDGAELHRARRVPGPGEEVPTGGPSRLARIHTPASTAFDAVH